MNILKSEKQAMVIGGLVEGAVIFNQYFATIVAGGFFDSIHRTSNRGSQGHHYAPYGQSR
jgi:hypothetical protein